jgi:hypothetical protein
MTATESASPTEEVIAQRARVRTMVERRRRFWRNILVFALVTIAMVLAALFNRDTQQLRAKRKEAGMIADRLQAVYDQQGYLPLRFPDLPEPYADLGQRYHFNILYANRQAWQRRVGVCCSRERVHFFLRAAGRPVVWFDGERFGPEWMTESEFQAAADDLGFDSLMRK